VTTGIHKADTYWRMVTMMSWLLVCAFLLFTRWGAIHWFSLADTDDNMRMMQVRALLGGQGWYDLTQYRLSAPRGFNIHWSRIVDLPLAAIILITKPFVGGAVAERIAIAIAPLLPLSIVLLSIGAIVRRLVAPLAYLAAILLLVLAPYTLGMFSPTRIDHHAWQLAALCVLAAALADPNLRRSGVVAGIATAFSITIGLEMLPYIVIAGSALVLAWVLDVKQAPRLLAFAAALAGGIAIGYLGFSSNANRAALCDAITPVWLSTMLVASAVTAILALWPATSWKVRLAAALGAGGFVAVFYALAWPHCLGQLEGISPQLQSLWLDNVSEARPVYRQTNDVFILMATMPVFGVCGYLWLLWRNRQHRDALTLYLPVVLLAVASTALLLFQARVAAAAQILSVPGVTYAVWTLVPKLRGSGSILVRVLGPVAVILLPSGLAFERLWSAVPSKAPTVQLKAVRKAGNLCNTLPALRPIALLPKTTILTFVDIGPRLITVTHHNAIAGPYHRNGQSILDVYRAFDGTADDARAVAQKYGATLILICPNMAESTQYSARSPKGFYTQLAAGKAPAWLDPVPLPKASPFMLWRLKKAPAL
jgi:hypothetical protein